MKACMRSQEERDDHLEEGVPLEVPPWEAEEASCVVGPPWVVGGGACQGEGDPWGGDPGLADSNQSNPAHREVQAKL